MRGRHSRKAPKFRVARGLMAGALILALSICSVVTVTANTVTANVVDGEQSYTFHMDTIDLDQILENHGYQAESSAQPGYIHTGVNWGYTGAQLSGSMDPATFIAMARQGIFFIPLVAILSLTLGVLGIQMTQAVSDLLTLLCAVPLQKRVLRELAAEIPASA